MNKLLEMLQDDTGHISSMRVVFLLVAVAVILPHIVLALKTGTVVTFSPSELELLGGTAVAKLFQNGQENTPPTPPAK